MPSVFAEIARVARERSGEIALADVHGEVRYGALIDGLTALAARFRSQGLREGDAVLVEGPDVAALVRSALAVREAGGVPCLAPAASADLPVRFAVSESGAGATLRPAGPGARLPEGTAWLRVTSGTTGAARTVAFTEAQALAGACRSAEMMALPPGDTVLSTAPASTAYGWNAGVLGPFLAGARVIHRPAWDLRGLLAAASSEGVRWIVSTPPVVRALARLAPEGRPRQRVRLLAATAAYPLEAATTVLERHGLEVIDRYGVTEAGPVAQADAPGGALRPGHGVVVRASGEPACLEIESDGVGLGYVGEDTLFGGRLRTADVATVEADGSFRITHRADRIVRRAGRSVDLARVEQLLVSLPGVSRARVEVRQGSLDLELVARIRPQADAAADVSALADRLRAALEPWERPACIEIARGDEVTDKWTEAEC